MDIRNWLAAPVLSAIAALSLQHHKESYNMSAAIARLTADIDTLKTNAAKASDLLSKLATEIRGTAGDEDAANKLADDVENASTTLATAITNAEGDDTTAAGATVEKRPGHPPSG